MMRRALLTVVLVAVTIAAAACALDPFGRADKVEIPGTYTTGDATYTLLYSTLGYDAAATKRLLVRLNDTSIQPQTGLAFRWRLVDHRGSQAASGTASYVGTGWGIPVWEADFSAVTKPGTYRVMVEAPDVALATRPFRIDDFLLSRATYVPLALDSAAARAAPAGLDNGFFESNTREGGAWAHAHFLNGLLLFYDERRNSITEDMRRRTLDAIERAADYLLLLTDPATGEVSHASPQRPYAGGDSAGDDAADTAAAAGALARYAALFQREDPSKADRAYRFAKLAETWLQENAPDAYSPQLEAAVALDLYRYAGDLGQLDRAVRIVGEFAPEYDLRTMERYSFDPMPHFETMYALWKSLPDHPDRHQWAGAAADAAAQYRDMLERNPFGVVPPGVTDPSTGDAPADQWDAVETDPLLGEGDGAVIGNEWFLARAIDAVYLADMTGDEELEQPATASILWITGLNPGAPSVRVAGASGLSPIEAASFIAGSDTGGNTRAVMPWSIWEWPRTAPVQGVASGFRRGFTLADDEATSGTSIARDGAWLAAVVVYESALHPGRRAAEPEPAPPPSAGVMRVSASVPSELDGALSLLVTVVDPSGRPLAGAKVSAVWSGAAAPGDAPEASVRVSQCDTAQGGVCALVLVPGDQPARPITVTITNLAHADYAYVPPAPVVSVTFPLTD